MKPFMIVFEGPECTGKSTQVKMLAEKYDCPHHKRVRTPNAYNRLSQVVDDINQQLLRTSGVGGESLVVFDRWQLVSDMVYEQCQFNRTSVFDGIQGIFADMCSKANIVVVYLDIDPKEMLKRFRIRGDNLVTEEMALATHAAYRKYFKEVNQLPYVRIDVTGLSEQTIHEEIDALIAHRMKEYDI